MEVGLRGPEDWFFCLRLLGGRYAFEAALVSEVVRLGPLTRLPAAPPFLTGVFTHRGEVLPVLDALTATSNILKPTEMEPGKKIGQIFGGAYLELLK